MQELILKHDREGRRDSKRGEPGTSPVPGRRGDEQRIVADRLEHANPARRRPAEWSNASPGDEANNDDDAEPGQRALRRAEGDANAAGEKDESARASDGGRQNGQTDRQDLGHGIFLHRGEHDGPGRVPGQEPRGRQQK